jgi:hypothetical protein
MMHVLSEIGGRSPVASSSYYAPRIRDFEKLL